MGKGLAFFTLGFGLILCSCGSGDDGMGRVDAALMVADAAQGEALALADARASELAAEGSGVSLFEGHLAVADRYSSLDLEKSLSHIHQALDLSEAEDCGPDARTRALLRLASLYNSQGAMLKDACDIFDRLNPAEMQEATRMQYYILGVQLNRSLADLAFDKSLSRRYSSVASAYRDTVISHGSNSAIIAANRMAEAGRLAEAEHLLKTELRGSPADDKSMAPIYHTLAGIYTRRGMHDEAVEALASAAMCDLEGGVREYKALPDLALAMLERGDVARAYAYIHRSARDAAACHASQRQLEIAASLPAIDAAYSRYQDRRTMTVALVSVCGLLLAAGAGLAYLMLRRKNRQLSESAAKLVEARDNLQSVNESMLALNDALASESRVKEQYIRAFMELCLSYLKKMESYRAELGKIAAKGDWTTLTQTIKSSRYVNMEVEQFFRQFDKAFLSLYPDFITGLNSLLRPEERYAYDAAFTTELRIYALLRLGVNSSGEIAKFLRCSESTVYNYRTQMRNKATDRSSFEADFIACKAV